MEREEIMREFRRPSLPSGKLVLGVAVVVGLLGAAASLSAAAPSYSDWSKAALAHSLKTRASAS